MTFLFIILSAFVAGWAYDTFNDRWRYRTWLFLSIWMALAIIASFLVLIEKPSWGLLGWLVLRIGIWVYTTINAQYYYNNICKELSPLFQRIAEENERNENRK